LKFFYLLPIIIIFSGCSVKQEHVHNSIDQQKETVSDLLRFDQDITSYVKALSKERYISSLEKYEKEYFSVWEKDKITISLDDAMWAYKVFDVKNSYGENLQLLQKSFFQNIYLRSNFEKFATLNKRAITLKRVNIRAFPTEKPLFMDPQKAGEGFPFDYLQNSSIAANKPVLVSHYSKEREWVFIQSSFAYGWVKADDIVFIPKKYTELYKRSQKEIIIKEGVAIYNEKGNFLFRSRIGMMFPEIAEDKDTYKVLTISDYKINQPYYCRSKLSKDIAHHGILEFNKKNIITIFREVSNVKYGWGGMYGQRDCSSILRDFFAPFGVWLPRNSYKQSKVGRIISLKELNNKEKLDIIKEKGVPFETLLYKRGHILLYVGMKDDTVIVFHNVWGIKTKEDNKEGRYILGKPVFSTLEIGSNLRSYDQNASILSQLQSMNIITQ